MPTVVRALVLVFLALCGRAAGYALPAEKPYDPRPLMDRLRESRKKDKYSFIVTGSFKNGGAGAGEAILRFSDRRLKPDFALFAGDMVSYGGDPVAKWEPLERHSGWFFRKYPSWAAQGDQGGPKEYRVFYGFPEDGAMDSYAFEFRNARFIQLSYYRYAWKKDRPWIESELRKARAGKQHVFVFTQRSLYHPGGGKYYLRERSKPPGGAMPVVELFVNYKVTCVFDGDNELYYRTRRNGVNYLKNQRMPNEGTDASNVLPGDVYYCRAGRRKWVLHNASRTPVDDGSIGGHPYVTVVEVDGATVRGRTLSVKTGQLLDEFVLAGGGK